MLSNCQLVGFHRLEPEHKFPGVQAGPDGPTAFSNFSALGEAILRQSPPRDQQDLE